MAKHESFETLGITDGITHLGSVDFLTPPPADSVNEITGIGSPKPQTLELQTKLNMEFGL